MNRRNNLKWKLQRYAIPNLTLYLILCSGIGYVLQLAAPSIVSWLMLDPFLILKGQIWRLVTWVLIPPESSNLFFVLIMLYLYYSLGNLLERIWGTWKYNVYLFSGMLFTILGAFVLCIYCAAMGAAPVNISGYTIQGMYLLRNETVVYFGMFSTYYVNMSIFLAFAVIYPDMEVMLYFILPIKMKWMALVYVVLAGYDFINGGIGIRVAIGASLLNFVIFFLSTRNYKRFGPREQARKAKFKKQSSPHMTYTNGAHHRCAVCGRTELDDPCLEFRFCSKCNGNYEYCQDHLFTHEHVK